MSLINEALKKAQSQRAEGSAASYEAATATGPRRGRTPKGNLYLIIGSAAVVLVVLSVVLTVFLVNGSSTPPSASTTSANPGPATVASSSTASSTETAARSSTAASDAGRSESRSFVLPGLTPKKETVADATSSPSAGTASAASSPSPAPTNSIPATAPANSTPTSPASAALPAAPSTGAGSFDQQVAAFVEAIRVTGIRSSGNESRVLMNERVYRVNDLVERSLGVKLVKVEADTLTFVDARGVTYEKHF